MPLSKRTYLGVIALLLLLGLAALLGIVAASLVLVERTREEFAEVLSTRQIRSDAADLLTLVQDMETGKRGYLLTGEPRYLEPYLEAKGRVGPQLDSLRADLADYPDLAPVFGRIETALGARLAEMDEVLQLYEAGRVEEAVGIIRTGRGNELLQQLRGALRQLREAAEARLDLSVADQEESARQLRWATFLGAAVVVLVVAGAVWLIVIYTRDLSRARRDVERLAAELEERVRDRTAELARANEEIQRFAYIVTHDLRAPLVNVMGFTSELEASLVSLQDYLAKLDAAAGAEAAGGGDGAGRAAEDPALEEAREAIERDLPEAIGFIRSSTRKMDGLINAILKISRDGRRPLKPEPIRLEELLETQAGSIRHRVGESEGSVELDVRVPALVSDRLSLEQIFGNLLDNAVKYRHPERPIELRIAARELGFGQVVVEVEDNGRGVAPQDHERVFELFRRSGNPEQPGEGIGLAHVRTLVRSLGGDITLSSEFGSGSSFRVQLPRDLNSFLRSRGQ